MTHKTKLIIGLILLSKMTFAQKSLPILKSNTNFLNIKEGQSLYKGVWRVSPEAKPDIFNTNPFNGKQKIVFYSDIDSITLYVQPNKKYDFVVLLNSKDSAYTQINTYKGNKPTLKPKLYYSNIDHNNKSATDTIPFRIGADNRIHILGTVNNSDILDLIYDTGAGMCVITSSLIGTKVKINIDGTAQNQGTDGTSMVNTSIKNKIKIGNFLWEDVSLLSIDYKPKSDFPFDVVLGWLVFEEKIVEINYDRKKIILHNSMPKLSSEYSKLEFKLINGIPFIKCKLVVNSKESETWFDFDTGANGELYIGQKFAEENNLNNVMKIIGTGTSKGSTGVEIQLNTVLLPKLKLGDFEMYQIPLSIPSKDPDGTDVKGNIGNNILKRFNTFIDFQNELIYLKPNRIFYSKM